MPLRWRSHFNICHIKLSADKPWQSLQIPRIRPLFRRNLKFHDSGSTIHIISLYALLYLHWNSAQGGILIAEDYNPKESHKFSLLLSSSGENKPFIYFWVKDRNQTIKGLQFSLSWVIVNSLLSITKRALETDLSCPSS